MIDRRELTPEETATKKDALERFYYASRSRDRISTRNVVGVGVGAKGTGDPNRPGVHVYVERLSYSDRMEHAAGPVPLGGGSVPVHAIESGRFFSFNDKAAPGSSIGLNLRDPDRVPNINSAIVGTLGAFVKLGPKYYALSANHVLAANGRVPKHTAIVFRPPDRFIDDDPGRFVFARRSVFVPLRLDPGDPNYVDAALAEVDEEAYERIKESFPERIVDTNELRDPELQMPVVRVDDYGVSESGRVIDPKARVQLDFAFGTFHFEDQIIIESSDPTQAFSFAKPGDSGALIVSEGKAVALVVGGSEKFAIACPIKKVFSELEGELARRSGKQAVAGENVRLELATGLEHAQPYAAPQS